MPIAPQRNSGLMIGESNVVNGMPCMSICDRSFPPEREADSDSSSSSSIGRNSDLSDESSDQEDSGENEVKSSFKGALDSIYDLEEVLPAKKGMSMFYSGKSKSFTSLSDATSLNSIQDLAKPEDPYAKKRKNLLAPNILLERRRSCSGNINGIPKRPANFGGGKSCIPSSSSSSSTNSDEGNSSSISPPSNLPPLHPHAKRLPKNESSMPPPRNLPWRSVSWSDLQSAAAEAQDISGLAICGENKGNKIH